MAKILCFQRCLNISSCILETFCLILLFLLFFLLSSSSGLFPLSPLHFFTALLFSLEHLFPSSPLTPAPTPILWSAVFLFFPCVFSFVTSFSPLDFPLTRRSLLFSSTCTLFFFPSQSGPSFSTFAPHVNPLLQTCRNKYTWNVKYFRASVREIVS